MVNCETQEEVDALWTALSEGGEEGPCGWLKARYGLSWQITPPPLRELPGGHRPPGAPPRLSEGPLPPVVPDQPDRLGRAAGRPRPPAGGEGHAGDAADEEDRHPGAAARRRGSSVATAARRLPIAAPRVEDLRRALAPQVLGALVRRYGRFDSSEDAVQEALLAAAM